MQVKPFMTTAEFVTLLNSDRPAAIRAARDIVARFMFTNLGEINVDFFENDGDLLRMAQDAIGRNIGHPFALFPLHPHDYVKTFPEQLDLLPDTLLQRMWTQTGNTDAWASPGMFPPRARLIAEILSVTGHIAPFEKNVWGKGALGKVPEPYNGPQGLRMPNTFWHKAHLAGGGDSKDATYSYTQLENWVIEMELRVYFSGDLLAERKLRSFYVEYVLQRVAAGFRKHARELAVWEATMLPIPHLAWKIRWYGRVCENGAYGRKFDKLDVRETTIDRGLVEILKAATEAANTPADLMQAARSLGWPEAHDLISATVESDDLTARAAVVAEYEKFGIPVSE